MTAQEAINRINFCKPPEAMWGKAHEAFEKAIKALEKQIPKDAVVLDKVYDEVRSCPACGKDTVYHGRTFFCYKCGQALKWGE